MFALLSIFQRYRVKAEVKLKLFFLTRVNKIFHKRFLHNFIFNVINIQTKHLSVKYQTTVLREVKITSCSFVKAKLYN